MTGGPSLHPIDRLIRDLIRTGRPASDDEVALIVERMATAPFSPGLNRVPLPQRGTVFEGQVLSARESSLRYHLFKRVVLEGQWASGTTAEQYLADLRRAIRTPSARLAVYRRGGEDIAASVTPTMDVLGPARVGTAPQANILVIHSATRGIIRSGYQFSALEATSIPGEARWLK